MWVVLLHWVAPCQMDESRWKCVFHRRVWTGTQRPSNLKLVKVKKASQTADTAKAATANGQAAWRTTASATRWVFRSCFNATLSLKKTVVYIRMLPLFHLRRRRSCARPSASASAARTLRRAQRGRHWCTWLMQQKCECSSRLQLRPSCPHRSQTCSHGRRLLLQVEAGGTGTLFSTQQ